MKRSRFFRRASGVLILVLGLGARGLCAQRPLSSEEIARRDAARSDAQRLLDAYGRQGEQVAALRQEAQELYARLFPTNRPGADRLLWSRDDFARNAHMERINEVLIPDAERERDRIGKEWDDRYEIEVGPISRWGTTIPVSYLDRSTNLIRQQETDYLQWRMGLAFDTSQPPPPAAPASRPAKPSVGSGATVPPPSAESGSAERAPAAPGGGKSGAEPTPPPAAVAKPWEEMTPAERHQALLRNDNAAWAQIAKLLRGDDAGAAAQARDALGGLPPPPGQSSAGGRLTPAEQAAWEAKKRQAIQAEVAAAMESVRKWNGMTPAQRHAALLRNDPAAWEMVRLILLSGRTELIADVLTALSRVPAPPSVPTEQAAAPGTASTPDSGPAKGRIEGLVSEVNPDATPFDDDLVRPVPGATVSISCAHDGQPFSLQVTTDAAGRFSCEVPLGAAVTVLYKDDSKSVTCTAEQPSQSVSFGGLQVPQVSTAEPDGIEVQIPPPPE